MKNGEGRHCERSRNHRSGRSRVERVDIEGPEILLKPDIAQVVSMVFHELSTNASKYGALSNAAGSIRISWGFVGDEHKRLFLQRQEAAGPPVIAPMRKGFGSVVLERMILQIAEASASLKFQPAGVVWYAEAPLASLVDADGIVSGAGELSV
jgi:two-component sensor histidine kinase